MLIPAAVSPAASNPTALTDVSVHRSSDGTTTVVLTTNAPIQPYGYRYYQIDAPPPREVLRLRGIVTPYRPELIRVDDSNLRRIRIGLHPDHVPPELHVVFDLTAPEVRILDDRVDGNTLAVRMGRPQPHVASTATPRPRPEPTSTPTPTPTATPYASPDPTATPAPTPTAAPSTPPDPTPTATPLPTFTPSPPPSPTRGSMDPDAGRTGISPTPSNRPTALYSAPAAMTSAPPTTAPILSEVVYSNRGDGSTVLRLTADRPFPPGSVLEHRDPDNPSRHLLVVVGVTAPGAPKLLRVDDANLRFVEVAGSPTPEAPEIRLALQLTSASVRVSRVATLGVHVAVLIEAE